LINCIPLTARPLSPRSDLSLYDLPTTGFRLWVSHPQGPRDLDGRTIGRMHEDMQVAYEANQEETAVSHWRELRMHRRGDPGEVTLTLIFTVNG
jgi:hypothetical protein